jgi:hypothetical protein
MKHTHAHARTHTHACTHTHAHTRARTHARTHTHTNKQTEPFDVQYLTDAAPSDVQFHLPRLQDIKVLELSLGALCRFRKT